MKTVELLRKVEVRAGLALLRRTMLLLAILSTSQLINISTSFGQESLKLDTKTHRLVQPTAIDFTGATLSNFPWSGLVSTPTTLSGYGITDGVSGTTLTSGNVISGNGGSSIHDSGVALIQLEANYQTATVSAAGNTNSNIASQLHSIKVTANAGSGAYTATVAIPTSGRVAGDRDSFHLTFAASANPTVEIHNNTSGGTLLFTWTGDGTATEIAGECVFDGSSWSLRDAHFAQ
jgi:hypothetical protein